LPEIQETFVKALEGGHVPVARLLSDTSCTQVYKVTVGYI